MDTPLEIEARFKTPRTTLVFDRLMTWFIKIGGLGVIMAVLTILLFILWQIIPLFASAHVTPAGSVHLPSGMHAAQVAALGVDEWGEAPFVLDHAGTICFLDAKLHCDAHTQELALGPGEQLSSCHYDPRSQQLCVGTSAGNLDVFDITYTPVFTHGVRTIQGRITKSFTCAMGIPGWPLVAVAFGAGPDAGLAVALQMGRDGRTHAYLTTLAQSSNLDGVTVPVVDHAYDLSTSVDGVASMVLVDGRAEGALIATGTGAVHYFFKVGDAFQLRQKFRPFEDCADGRLGSMGFLVGDASLCLTNHKGVNRIFSLYHKDGSDTRLFGQTKQMPPLAGPPTGFAGSVRNHAYLLTSAHTISLRYSTSAMVRWQMQVPYELAACALSSKYRCICAVGTDDQVHMMNLDDAHPESGFNALFGKVWYEGADAPSYAWQSTGSEDFEPKLSMIPLLAGTLKGTFYAIIFAIPIALLGAIYTSEFMHPRFKGVIKPAVEIMASLPSVVLGFIAALWLSQFIEHRVPSLLLMIILVPAVAMLFGWFWANLPMRHRSHIPPGYEFLAFLPLLVLTVMAAWQLGPLLENLLFVVTDPVSHQRIGDFPNWWREVTRLSYVQRNSLVVGIMMGFAVIPIIFTIAEDALANVPSALRSGSLALGASRWQTAFRVVVPTASAGIFSALMIGLGRAIGETMIVVMATGNTAVMNMNIFDGMRTLSANIAVELSEAAQHSTLYHALFLGAFLLFAMTFIINTAAEMLRQHLREKYKTV